MSRRKLIANILIRLLLIIINTLLIFWSYQFIENEYLFVFTSLSLFIIVQIILFVRFFLRLHSDIDLFFDAISNNDSLLFKPHNNSLIISNYNSYFDKINSLIKNKNIEISKQKAFLESLLNNAQVGFISFLDNGEIETFNQYAKQLLNINNIRNINELNEINDDLPSLLKTITPTKNQTVRIIESLDKNNGITETKVLSIKKSIFTIDNKTIHLVSFSNIKNELENNEIESWQKLIRILSHEIMNSISPIVSLNNAMGKYLQKINHSVLDVNSEKYFNKTLKGIKTIEQTCSFLLNFVQQYRNLTLVPKPIFSSFKISVLFDDIKTLFYHELQNNNIELKTKTESNNDSVYADINLLKQVLVNLIKNSITALQNTQEPSIKLIHFKNHKQQNVIQIMDNGIGIDESVIDKIFIPFFTTQNNGTGVGLSLAKQILRLHSGDIRVESIPNKGTIFSLVL